jgi:hypothetical protein
MRWELRALLCLGTNVAGKQLGDRPDMVGLLRESDDQQNEQFCSHNGDKSTNLKLNLQF